MATTVTYKGQTLATVENQTKTLQTKGTWVEDDFTLTDVTQGGGGDLGGLADMVDVSDQDYNFGYMLSAMKNGDTVGGKVTYSTAFANTEQKILETGLTTLHGVMFVAPSLGYQSEAVGQTCKFAIITINEDNTFNMYGQPTNSTTNLRVLNSLAQSTLEQNQPLNGSLRFSGGDIYYTGRYNKNANYQMLRVGVEYEWLAW